MRTFKRDSARLNPPPDACTVLGQLGRVFDEYIHNHPHSGLGVRSPHEFIGARQPTKMSGQTRATTTLSQNKAKELEVRLSNK